VRKCEECLKFNPNQRQAAGKFHTNHTTDKVEAWKPNAVGADRLAFKVHKKKGDSTAR